MPSWKPCEERSGVEGCEQLWRMLRRVWISGGRELTLGSGSTEVTDAPVLRSALWGGGKWGPDHAGFNKVAGHKINR